MSDSKFLIANFRSWAGEHQIDLNNINLLLGSNSSGKSSIIHALSLLKQSILTSTLIPTGDQIDLGRISDQINNQAKSKDPKTKEGQLGFGIVTGINQKEILEIPMGMMNIRRREFIRRRRDGQFQARDDEIRKRDSEIFASNFSELSYSEHYDDAGRLQQIFLNWNNISIIKITVLRKLKRANIQVEVTAEKKFWDKIIDKEKLLYKQEDFELEELVERLRRREAEYESVLLKELIKDPKKNKVTRNTRSLMSRGQNKRALRIELERLQSEIEQRKIYKEKFYENNNINYEAIATQLSFEVNLRNATIDSYNIVKICARLSRGGAQFEHLMDILGVTEKNNPSISKIPKSIESILGLSNSLQVTPLHLLTIARGKFSTMVERVQRIGPHRERPDRISIINPNERGSFVGIYGEKLNTLMNQMSKREIKNLNDWFKILEIPYTIDKKYDSRFNILQVLLIDEQQNKISLSDVGYGIGQVLPIILICVLSRKSIITIEQPELHLHPKLQANLADLFIKSALENQNLFILETHSEHIVLRFKRRQRESINIDEEIQITPADKLKTQKRPLKFPQFVGYSDGEGQFEGPTWENIRQSLTISVVDTKKSPLSSKITKIKLNRQGEFDTIWPGDFFPERYIELGLED